MFGKPKTKTNLYTVQPDTFVHHPVSSGIELKRVALFPSDAQHGKENVTDFKDIRLGLGTIIGNSTGRTVYNNLQYDVVKMATSDPLVLSGKSTVLYTNQRLSTPLMKGGSMAIAGSMVTVQDGVHALIGRVQKDTSVVVHVITGLNRVRGETDKDREHLMEHMFLTSKSISPMHGACPLEKDIEFIEGVTDITKLQTSFRVTKFPELLHLSFDPVTFFRDEIWTIEEGCKLLVVGATCDKQGQPKMLVLRNERGKLTTKPGKPELFETFRAFEFERLKRTLMPFMVDRSVLSGMETQKKNF